jgi:hypothetical protein
MTNCVRIKDGVEFKITPAGIHMLSALDMIARQTRHDLTITSAADGQHSGTEDPHKQGNAFDVRSKDLPDKQIVLNRIKVFLGEEKFYIFLEDPLDPNASEEEKTQSNEHFHMQLRHGLEYP